MKAASRKLDCKRKTSRTTDHRESERPLVLASFAKRGKLVVVESGLLQTLLRFLAEAAELLLGIKTFSRPLASFPRRVIR